MIGVVCPSVFEYEALDRSVLGFPGARVVCSGMGKLRAMYACARLHREHPDLKALLLIGFAGGLTADLAIGDLVEPDTFVEQDYCAEPFEKFPNILQSPAGQKRLMTDSRQAVMLTQDRFLTENPYKDGPLAKKFRTLACDMESYAVAHYALEAKLRFHVLKFISDTADHTAEHDFLAACKRLAPELNRRAKMALEKI